MNQALVMGESTKNLFNSYLYKALWLSGHSKNNKLRELVQKS